MKISPEWHKSFYRLPFYNPAGPAASAMAPAEVRYLLELLRPARGAGILDLCCGPGRHAVLLAKKGLRVTGFDYSRDYLELARAAARRAKTDLRLVRGDMRRLPFDGEFDAVLNLFTSFGYFTPSEDLGVLRGVRRALKPGGAFLLDVVNGEHVRRNFAARDWHKAEDGSYMLSEAELTADGVRQEWTLIKNGKAERRAFFTRLYTRRTISSALRKAGLEPVLFRGDFSGAALDRDARRLIVLARRPGGAA